jgi:hypothetical protein
LINQLEEGEYLSAALAAVSVTETGLRPVDSAIAVAKVPGFIRTREC